jgi:hypothetical protein
MLCEAVTLLTYIKFLELASAVNHNRLYNCMVSDRSNFAAGHSQ